MYSTSVDPVLEIMAFLRTTRGEPVDADLLRRFRLFTEDKYAKIRVEGHAVTFITRGHKIPVHLQEIE